MERMSCPTPCPTHVLGERRHAQVARRDLAQQVDVGDRVADVAGEVRDLPAAVGARQVVVDPADEDLLRRQPHQLLEALALEEERREARVLVEVDVAEQADLREGVGGGAEKPGDEIQEHSRTFEDIRGHSRTFENIREHSRKFENIREHSRTFENIREHSRTFKNIQGRSRTFKNIQEHSRTFKNIQEHSRTFWGKNVLERGGRTNEIRTTPMITDQ